MPTGTSTITKTTTNPASAPSTSLRNGSEVLLRQMRKGTKSCQECRRRKIKCNYPPTPPSSPSSASSPTLPRKCIECTTHDRQCLIQGVVARPGATATATASSTSHDPSDAKPPPPPPTRIYKRRRGPGPPPSETRVDDDAGDYESDNADSRARVKIHVDRIDSIVERIARDQNLNMTSSPDSRSVSVSASTSTPTSTSIGVNGGTMRSGTDGSSSTLEPFQAPSASPLLSQLFSNEIFSQTSYSPSILTEKTQVMTFADVNSNVTDVEKLLSTISSEPYVLDVLDISARWWIAWRDHAFALHDVSTPQAETCKLDVDSGVNTVPFNHGPRRDVAPVSLRDFVREKLSQDDAISVSSGLLCVATSLFQLRPGMDDADLIIASTSIELAERIVLAVDTVILSPSANPGYMRDPAVLPLLMMRSKLFGERNQLRKCWLSVRRAIDAARDMGYAEPQMPLDREQDSPKLREEELTSLLHRQRFLGSMMEIERLVSMVLGFPHVEDVKFTDNLAMAVLQGQLSTEQSAPEATMDIKMRALRRVVAVAAGRVNARNGSSDSDDVKLQRTSVIQGSLSNAAAAMPRSWWLEETHIHHFDPYVAYEHLATQMWFWQVQTFLHLPFMLKANPHYRSRDQNDRDPDNQPPDPYEVNRFLCLQGCRGMLRVFNIIRSEPPISVYVGACEDFQGVFCACVLMVGLIIRLSFCPHTLPDAAPALMGNVEEDIALLEEVKETLRYRATHQAGCISKQGLRALEELGSYLGSQDEAFFEGEYKRRTVVLPYFGAIHLELRPPRHLLGKVRQTQLQSSGGKPSSTPLASGKAPVEEAFGSTLAGPAAQAPFPEWEITAANASFGMSIPEGNLDWDQFLFGDELARDWEADLPEWPTEKGAWEWQ